MQHATLQTFQFRVSSDGNIRDHVEALGVTGSRQFVVGTFSGGDLRLYVDGVLQDQKASAVTSVYVTDVPLRI